MYTLLIELFDPNTRSVISIGTDNENKETSTKELSTKDQVIAIAIPILSLLGPTAMVLMAGVGLMEAKQAYHAYRQAQIGCDADQLWETKKLLLKKTAMVVVICATPLLYTVIASMEAVYAHSKQLQATGDNKERGKIALAMLHEIIYCGSMVVAIPELLTISMIAQAALEAYHARRDFQHKNYIKGIGTLALSMMRLHRAMPHLETLKNKYLPEAASLFALPAHYPARKRLQQQDLDMLLAKISESRASADEPTIKSFSSLLDEHQFDYYLGGLKIKGTSNDPIDLSHMEFTDLTFDHMDLAFVDLTGSTFDRTTFISCSLEHIHAVSALFRNTIFVDSSLKYANFYHAMFDDVLFRVSQFYETFFTSSNLQQVTLKDCRLDETQFMFAGVQNVGMSNTEMINCVLGKASEAIRFHNTTYKTTKLIVAMPWDFEDMSERGMSVLGSNNLKRDFNALVLKFPDNSPDISSKRLETEIQTLIETPPSQGHLSIPDAMLRRAPEGSEMATIKDRAREITSVAHALLIPGSGLDVNPRYYGAEVEDRTYLSSDPQAEMFKFALVQAADQREMPILGICQGAQVVNVYRGGTLKQHVGGHSTEHLLTPLESSPLGALTYEIVGKQVIAVSRHHQASDEIGNGLTVTMWEGNVPEMLLHPHKPVILTQFHPEKYESLDYDPGSYEGIKERESTLSDSERAKLDRFQFQEGPEQFSKAVRQAGLEANKNIFRYFVSLAARYYQQQSPRFARG